MPPDTKKADTIRRATRLRYSLADAGRFGNWFSRNVCARCKYRALTRYTVSRLECGEYQVAIYTRTIRAAIAAACVAFPLSVAAQATFPSKPIRFLVGFTPGGTTDILARDLAQKMTESMGQSVVVENRAGANTSIATELVARAVPDGHTILLNAQGHATNASLMKLAFDPVRDFAFISLVAEAQNLIVVHPSFPPRTVRELIAFS